MKIEDYEDYEYILHGLKISKVSLEGRKTNLEAR